MKAFWRNQRGVAALEFALIFPFLLVVTVGAIDVALETFMDAALDRGASAASRIGVTVVVPAGVDRDQAIYNAIWGTVGQFLQSPSQLTVSTMTYPNYSSIGQPEPCGDDSYAKTGTCTGPFTDINGNGHWDRDMGASGAGGYGAIVRYQVKITRPTFTGIPAFLNIKQYSLQRTIVVQNES
ncbi:TadE/TadG family type IV pilus assembly protein [Paludibacterium purpuratum]|uniref:TadE-like protein n=1 Tax=Paludibacterium purpuratum TaxID=1144873 RepID=A0A4R7B6D2_9NEIS|nr:TadE/TadG family type IV pilus assembly protein [Paludibacterium purpuratum]TDR80240.1 TadE-like protein [Paludibacterium purpuratum]